MRRIPVVQIGVGGVGRALIEQVLWFNEQLGGRYGFRFAYIGLADSRSAIVDDERIPPAVLLAALDAKRSGGSLLDIPQGGPLNDWRDLLTPLRCIVVDVSAQDGAEAGLQAALDQGHAVVLANKKPLCASFESFTALTDAGRTRYEATVGAGLPVIMTLRMLLDTGDRVTAISGCLSGTLGFLMTELEGGASFAAALRTAMQRGWTEPDPRDDLSGMDVARKALILARTIGLRAELSDVEVEALYPTALATLPRAAFVERLEELDAPLTARMSTAAQHHQTLRYVADIGNGHLRVGLRATPRDSILGSLRGPDNLIAIHSQRYAAQPLIVRGPGAGVEVTASAVLNDMLALARTWR